MYFAFKDWFKLLVIKKNLEENVFKTKKIFITIHQSNVWFISIVTINVNQFFEIKFTSKSHCISLFSFWMFLIINNMGRNCAFFTVLENVNMSVNIFGNVELKT